MNFRLFNLSTASDCSLKSLWTPGFIYNVVDTKQKIRKTFYFHIIILFIPEYFYLVKFQFIIDSEI